MMGVTLDYNLGLVESAISDASSKILTMEEQGFYVVREKGILAKAEVNYVAAEQLYESGKYMEGYDAAKKSYIDAKNTLGDLNNLYLDAASSVYIIIGFLASRLGHCGFPHR